MGRYLAIGIVEKIYIEKKEKFKTDAEKQQLFRQISKTIDLSYYEGEEDIEEKSWLFTLKEEVWKEYLEDFTKETFEHIKKCKKENSWKSFDQEKFLTYLEKNNMPNKEIKNKLSDYLWDDFWPEREYTTAFLKKNEARDIKIYPSFIILWIDFNSKLKEEETLLSYLNLFAHKNDKNPLGKCSLFYITEK